MSRSVGCNMKTYHTMSYHILLSSYVKNTFPYIAIYIHTPCDTLAKAFHFLFDISSYVEG